MQITVCSLNDFYKTYNKNIIGIDEVQFFNEPIVDIIQQLVDTGKKVIFGTIQT